MAKAVRMVRGKARPISTVINIAIWLTGILVSLAVGFGMIGQILTVPYIPEVVTIWAGWVVVVLTVLSMVLAILERL